MGILAVASMAAVVVDRTIGLGDRPGPAVGTHASPGGDRVADQIIELRRMRAALPAKQKVQLAYTRLAPVYAEHIAGFVGVHTGQPHAGLIRDTLAQLIAPGVDTIELLPGGIQARGNGIHDARVILRLSSQDSYAMTQTLLALGDPASGVAWEEFDLVANPDDRSLALTGRLVLTLIEPAE